MTVFLTLFDKKKTCAESAGSADPKCSITEMYAADTSRPRRRDALTAPESERMLSEAGAVVMSGGGATNLRFDKLPENELVVLKSGKMYLKVPN